MSDVTLHTKEALRTFMAMLLASGMNAQDVRERGYAYAHEIVNEQYVKHGIEEPCDFPYVNHATWNMSYAAYLLLEASQALHLDAVAEQKAQERLYKKMIAPLNQGIVTDAKSS